MLLRDIKKGEVYAYIPGYGQMTRKQEGGVYCGKLPSAKAVEVVDKEKRLVEIRKDSCGRPKMQNQTFLVCNVIDIAPTDIMAGELDIVKNKHADLVIFDTESVNAADLIWPWDMEIEQARKNAENMRQVENRVAYIKGIEQRALDICINNQRLLADALRPALTKVVGKDMADQQLTIRATKNMYLNELQRVVYDVFRGDTEARFPVNMEIQVQAEAAFGTRRSYHDPDCVSSQSSIVVKFCNIHDPKTGNRRYSQLAEKYIPEEYAARVVMEEELAEVREKYSHWGAEANVADNKLQQAKRAETKAWRMLSSETKIEIIDNFLVDFGKVASEKIGSRIAKFNPKKNWVKWAEELGADDKE